MIRISSIIALLGNAILFLITLFLFIPNNLDRKNYLFGYATILIITLCNILFIKNTRYNKIDNSELEQLENDNKLLRLKIEQEKMKKILK